MATAFESSHTHAVQPTCNPVQPTCNPGPAPSRTPADFPLPPTATLDSLLSAVRRANRIGEREALTYLAGFSLGHLEADRVRRSAAWGRLDWLTDDMPIETDLIPAAVVLLGLEYSDEMVRQILGWLAIYGTAECVDLFDCEADRSAVEEALPTAPNVAWMPYEAHRWTISDAAMRATA